MNYDALQKKIAWPLVRPYLSTAPSVNALNTAGVMALVVIACLLLFTFTAISRLPLVLMTSLSGLATVQYLSLSTLRAHNRARLREFAHSNPDVYLISDVPNPEFKGMIFDIGRARRLRDMLTIIGLKVPLEIGVFSYITGHGKSRREHQWTFVRIKLSRNLPHIVLDAVSNRSLGLSSLPVAFDASQSFGLEGDFDKYFKLYAPRKYGKDALYVFTPDVMAAAIDYTPDMNAEIIDDELYLFVPRFINLSAATQLQRLLKVGEIVGARVEHQADYYLDDAIDIRELNVVAAPGQRLRTGLNLTALLTATLSVLATIIRLGASLLGYGTLIGVILFVILAALLVWLTFQPRNKPLSDTKM